MAFQLTFRTPAGEQVVVLDGPIVVGRDPSCQVPIDSVRVSRRHAEFAPAGGGVSVRDLGSRNGIIVNGTRVSDALIGPADRVLLGDVSVTAQAISPGYAAPPAAAEPVLPVVVPAPATYEAPRAPSVPASFRQAPSYPPAWAGSGGGGDKTTVLPRGMAPPGPPSVPQAAALADKSLVGKVGRRLGVGGMLAVYVIVPVVAAVAIAAVPLVMARNQVIQRESLARASTIVRLLGAENGQTLASGQNLAVSVASAMDSSGVREALVLSPEGRVLAPPERLDESIAQLTWFGDVATLQGLLTAQTPDGMVEALAVVETGGRRLGVVWVRLDPGQVASATPVGLYLLAAVFTALAVGGGFAFLARRTVTAKLAAFATDIDLAAAGQLDVVTEPFGMPRLAESVNFILGRLRAAPQARPEPVAYEPPRPAGPPQGTQAREGTLVIDAGFMIREASAGAAQMLRTAPDKLVNHHVLEAIADQALVNAVIDAIGDLSNQPHSTRRVECAGQAPVELQVSRTAPDGPINVSIRSLG